MGGIIGRYANHRTISPFPQTNSFQMVLATDEVYTYAIFNYGEINWSSHTEAGGDTTGGEGGVPAYVSLKRFAFLNDALKLMVSPTDWIQCW